MKCLAAIVYAMLLLLGTHRSEAQDGNFQGRKLALVFGLSRYGVDPLPNAVNDAEDIASALKKIGFDVTLKLDAKFFDMRIALAKFESRLPEGSVALVYFAGHGVQFEGNSYLLPIGSIQKVRSAGDLARQAFGLSDLASQLGSRRRSINIMIIDACRNSPFKAIPEIGSGLSRGTPIQAAGAGLGPRKAGRKSQTSIGNLIAYSTAPNNVAEDGDGRNSPYTKHLKQLLLQPEISIENILKQTRLAVTRETKGRQTPWYESSISGDFFPAGRGRVEFRRLLELLVPEKHREEDDRSSYSHDWSIGAYDGSPIKWLHDGPRDTSEKADFWDFKSTRWGSPYLRSGEVVITFDGQPTHHVLNKRQVPGKWRIILAGPRAGVDAVAINNNALSYELGWLPKAPYLVEDVACQSRMTEMNGTSVYKVELPGRSRAWLGEQLSCGSGGCSAEYILVYDREDTKRLGCS